MELLLIRHALPVRRDVSQGPADPELSAIGHVQATHLAEYMAIERLDAIYASPLRRAQQTATPLAERQGLPILTEDGIAEYDRASASYIPAEELKRSGDPRWHEMMKGPQSEHAQAVARAFRETVIGAITTIADRHIGEKVAVVCHAGVIGAYLADVLDISLVSPSFFAANYTSISRVMASRHGSRSLFTINETSHLRGSGLPTGLYDPRP